MLRLLRNGTSRRLAHRLVAPYRVGIRAFTTDGLSHLNPVSCDDLEEFTRICGKDNVLVCKDYAGRISADWTTVAGTVDSSSVLRKYTDDWQGKYRSDPCVVVRPKTTEQVSRLLRRCHEQRIGVVPQGGNTGLVGGSTPVQADGREVVLSLERMNRILEFDDFSGVLTCEAGVVLEAAEHHVGKHGFCMPLDLGAKGSCMLGGNLSTNAGGIRYTRYGSLRGNVLGVEAVLPDGRVLNELSGLKKDNTGYDWKQLFLGGEGTLGVVTKMSIATPALSPHTNVALLACPTYHHVVRLLKHVRASLGEVVSAVEFMDVESMSLVVTQLGHRYPLSQLDEDFTGSEYELAPGGVHPDDATATPPHSHFDGYAPFYMLVETRGCNAQHDADKLDACLVGAMEQELMVDGVVAQDQTQMAAMWALRESVAEALVSAGAVYKYDVSVPRVADLYQLVHRTRQQLEAHRGGYDSWRAQESAAQDQGAVEGRLGGVHKPYVVGYGHLGDGNLHLNVLLPNVPFCYDTQDRLEPFIFEEVKRLDGSISAEHGLGRCKNEYLHFSKPTESVEVMRALKQVFDPHGIMNPSKFLPGK